MDYIEKGLDAEQAVYKEYRRLYNDELEGFITEAYRVYDDAGYETGIKFKYQGHACFYDSIEQVFYI